MLGSCIHSFLKIFESKPHYIQWFYLMTTWGFPEGALFHNFGKMFFYLWIVANYPQETSGKSLDAKFKGTKDKHKIREKMRTPWFAKFFKNWNLPRFRCENTRGILHMTKIKWFKSRLKLWTLVFSHFQDLLLGAAWFIVVYGSEKVFTKRLQNESKRPAYLKQS